ncbi:MAG: hypothetical protein Q4F83_11165 [Eubacteriales bacterium]|nr:hypothetical protein [Eubacteriales bacterium]
MVSKNILIQYADLQEEIKEVRKKIAGLEDRIPKIQKRIDEIEAGEIVKDKVRGGEGGWQSFNIEGIPIMEYEKKKTDLLTQKLMLNQRKSTLEILEFDLLQKTNEVEEFIASVEDSRMRRIINLRCIENLSWCDIARRIGGGNTEDSIRMAFNRFMAK